MGLHLPASRLQDLRKVANRPWKSLSMKEKARLLGALDWLSFSFIEAIKEKGSERADNWLWQVSELRPRRTHPIASASVAGGAGPPKGWILDPPSSKDACTLPPHTLFPGSAERAAAPAG